MLTSTSQGGDPNELLEDDSVPSTSGRLHVQIGLRKSPTHLSSAAIILLHSCANEAKTPVMLVDFPQAWYATSAAMQALGSMWMMKACLGGV